MLGAYRQEHRRPAEREDREPERRIAARIRDGDFIADGDRNQREHHQRQGPRAPTTPRRPAAKAIAPWWSPFHPPAGSKVPRPASTAPVDSICSRTSLSAPEWFEKPL
jgi:hypothetical protein